MKYREFAEWCNKRACDGCWSAETATYCINIMNEINKLPFWRRNKEWQKYKDMIEREVVSVIEEKIKRNVERYK